MNILIAIKSMNNEGGGAERVLSQVSSGLAERGHTISLLTYDKPGGKSYYPVHDSINRISLEAGDAVQPSGIAITLKRIVKLRSVIQESRPDIVVAFMHSMFIPLGLALKGTGIPVVASEHIVPEHYIGRPLERFLLQLTPYLAEKITVVSEQARDSYPQSLKRIMVPIANPVEIKVEGTVNLKGDTRKTLLSIGRFVEQKDHLTLIRAFSQIAKSVPDWDLRLVGDGELKQQLQTEIMKSGLQDRVSMPGCINSIETEYTNAQLFVMPSRYESFGLTTAEAISYGLPVVGFSDCPGTNFLIKHEYNGLLVSGENRVQSLANGLLTLMSDPGKRMSLGNRSNKHLNEYELESIVAKWESLLEGVCIKKKHFGTLNN